MSHSKGKRVQYYTVIVHSNGSDESGCASDTSDHENDASDRDEEHPHRRSEKVVMGS